jgi:hypothetical protein
MSDLELVPCRGWCHRSYRYQDMFVLVGQGLVCAACADRSERERMRLVCQREERAVLDYVAEMSEEHARGRNVGHMVARLLELAQVAGLKRWVRYEDHAAALAESRAECERLRISLDAALADVRERAGDYNAAEAKLAAAEALLKRWMNEDSKTWLARYQDSAAFLASAHTQKAK